jgi:hypothetical protein
LGVPPILQNCHGVLERVPHSLESLNLKLQSVSLLHVGIAPYSADHTTHEAVLRVIRELAFNGAETTLFSKQHVVGRLNAGLLPSNV